MAGAADPATPVFTRFPPVEMRRELHAPLNAEDDVGAVQAPVEKEWPAGYQTGLMHDELSAGRASVLKPRAHSCPVAHSDLALQEPGTTVTDEWQLADQGADQGADGDGEHG